MLPVVIDETLTSLFSFYREGCIHPGMSYRTELYELISLHPVEARLQAYTIGCERSEQGMQVVITVSSQHYKVWGSLRIRSAEPAATSRSAVEV